MALTRSKNADRMARQRAAEREIEIPRCKNPIRRNRCRLDLNRFVDTYLSKPPDADRYPGTPAMFYLPLSPLHRRILKRFQDLILFGGLAAEAEPRGFGKDTLAKGAAIWAACYGHSAFTVFACFEASAAADRIADIKTQLEINRVLCADFPEVCEPIRALERAPQRAKQQTFRGEFTRLEFGAQVVLASIKGKPSSGCIIAPGSLNGSIRGLNVNGQRPSFVIVTDPQTREVAKSKTQIEDVMRKIQADFGGLGAMDKPLSALALVTVIERGDVADQLTDMNENPQWNGQRFGAITQWPERMDLWEEYEAQLDAGMRSGDTSGRGANAFYLSNRTEMDRGAATVWDQAFIKSPAPDGTPQENSALQHFMNVRWRFGHDAFQTEYQNEPPAPEGDNGLTPELVASRLSGMQVGVVPDGAVLVQAIDVRAREIHWVVKGFSADGTSTVVDYGIDHVDAPAGNLRDDETIKRALDIAILDALRARRDLLRAQPDYYRLQDGTPVAVSLTLVDSGWRERAVYQFTQESGPNYRPTKGAQAGHPGQGRYSSPGAVGKTIMRIGEHWDARRQASGVILYLLDADHWKLYTQERWLQDPGTPGAATIYGDEPREHRRFSQHICSERWDPEKGKFVSGKWNHFLDCDYMACVAANMLGVRLMGGVRPAVKTVSLKDIMGGRASWR